MFSQDQNLHPFYQDKTFSGRFKIIKILNEQENDSWPNVSSDGQNLVFIKTTTYHVLVETSDNIKVFTTVCDLMLDKKEIVEVV